MLNYQRVSCGIFSRFARKIVALKVDEPIMVIFHGSVELQESRSTKHTQNMLEMAGTQKIVVYITTLKGTRDLKGKTMQVRHSWW
jgi:hypothetical protein